jgi:cardiolipin synthase
LHLHTYIFDEDSTGNKVAEALIRAAERKVYVYVLLDGYASQKLSAEFIARLTDAGIHFGFFNPFFKRHSYYIGRRLHHKVIVADARVCMVAGINISDRYNDIGDTMAWLDWAVYAEGDVAKQLNDVCIKMWDRPRTREQCIATQNPASPLPAEEYLVRVRRNDRVYRRTEITKTYREIFHTATKEVILMTSYFWPPQKLLKRMTVAARRGVKIKVILTAKADVPFSKYAERYLYSLLFRNNIEVYEYQANVLHGKVAVCDSEWFTAGSYNVNNISAYASVELNLDVRNKLIATQLNDQLQSIIKEDCVQITDEDIVNKTSIMKRIGYYLSYRLIHWVFFLFTFYFVQQREQH